MGKVSVTVLNGPLQGSVFAIDEETEGEVNFRLDDGSVVVYRVRMKAETRRQYFGYEDDGTQYPIDPYDYKVYLPDALEYVGLDPFA